MLEVSFEAYHCHPVGSLDDELNHHNEDDNRDDYDDHNNIDDGKSDIPSSTRPERIRFNQVEQVKELETRFLC